MLKLGTYRHYKGNLYDVIGVATHSETHEKFVVYRALYDTEDLGSRPLFVRPLNMFLEDVEVNGILVKRFDKIQESTSPHQTDEV